MTVSRVLDDLTGAAARSELAPALAEFAARRDAAGEHHALAVMDVDNLKSLNDVYGHATGDAALRAVAARALGALRSGDRLFRYGGDEFVILLPDTDRAGAEAILRRVHQHVTADPVQAAVWVSVGVSVGVAATDERDGRDLFTRADDRARRAKRAGRNAVLADDGEAAPPADPLSGSRLVGRDPQLAAFSAFLATPGLAVLRVDAPAGAGVTRFLDELAVRARQAGRAVRRLDGRASRSGLHLWALDSAYAGVAHHEGVERDLAGLMANDAEARGLVLLVTAGPSLDLGSVRLVEARLGAGGAKLVEVVAPGAHGAFAPDERLQLTPLAPAEVGAWLGAALGGPLDGPLVAALTAAGEGLPGRVARLVGRLVASGALVRRGGVWSAEPSAVAREAARLAAEGEAGESGGRAAPRVTLPAWETPLVGRAPWLRSAGATAREHRLVTLVGAGGAGKSRLAAQLALELAHDPAGGAADGTHWVDLRSVGGAGALPGALAEAAGLEGVEDAEDLAARLGTRELRLVLDNADAVAEWAGGLPRLLARAPGLSLLVTSRMPLRLPGEVVLAVPALTHVAARELFRHGMRRVGVQDEPDERLLDEVLLRVGREPLALELAAAWTRILSGPELLARLDEQPGSLVAVPGMQPLTTRFIDVARRLMSEEEQAALGTLALIPGGFTAEDGREASGASAFFLLALLERSLLRRDGERYSVHSAIAERFRAALADVEAAEGRVARTYSGLARRLGELPGRERTERGFKLVDAERANLESALTWLAKRRDVAGVWPLVRLLRGYYDVRGRSRRGLAVFRQVDEALAGAVDAELLAWVREARGLFHWQRGEVNAARECVADALALLAPGGPNATFGMVLNTAGIVMDGDFDEQVGYFDASARMRASLGDEFGEAQARGNVALLLASRGRHEEAYAALQVARRNYVAVRHDSGLALTLASMAQQAHAGRLPAAGALALAREGLELAERIGYPYGARLAATAMAEVLAAGGRGEEAAAAFARAARWAREEERPALEHDLHERAAAARLAGQAALAADPESA